MFWLHDQKKSQKQWEHLDEFWDRCFKTQIIIKKKKPNTFRLHVLFYSLGISKYFTNFKWHAQIRLYYCGFKYHVLPCFVHQLTGTPLVPSWSSLPCHASLESLLESSLLPTFQPLRGSIAPLLLASCSLFQVSGVSEWVKLIQWCSGQPVHHDNRPGLNFKMCISLSSPEALFVLLAMAIYTGVTVNFLGKRFGDWRFSWSYILGWVALLMTFFAGLF